MIPYMIVGSPCGRLLVQSTPKGIARVQFEDGMKPEYKIKPQANWKKIPHEELNEHPLLSKAKTQLEEYFAGKRQKFTVELDPQGTDFQKSVWKGLVKIPYGKTVSYGDVGDLIGKHSTSGEEWHVARAIGSANSRNPTPILVPCHRVIAKGGKLSGFSGGVENKAKLIQLESDYLDQGSSSNTNHNAPKLQVHHNAHDQHTKGKSKPSDHDGDSRPMCKFGASCYRRNEDHRQEFRHPNDDAPDDVGMTSEEEREMERQLYEDAFDNPTDLDFVPDESQDDAPPEKAPKKRSKKNADDDETNGEDEIKDEDVQKPKKRCMYGKSCYRTNPDHLAQFSHDDDDKAVKKQKS
eukprot:TRINITY_DN3534_c0_g1_i2.p1 TRINITY_DN3534_c0_g1~~TRINITY_DN3534_c0_g1_i2.p1  ORF type:complete len:351 (+),score=96.00 TRINITY_DN3534_c0_g1_i2:153-1205(+)